MAATVGGGVELFVGGFVGNAVGLGVAPTVGGGVGLFVEGFVGTGVGLGVAPTVVVVEVVIAVVANVKKNKEAKHIY